MARAGVGRHLVETTLSRAFKRPVTVRHLGLRLATGELELAGLRVGGVTPEAPPFLEIDSVRVRPSVAPWRGNRIVLSRVRLEGMRLRIHAFPSPPLGPGGDDIPKLGGGGGGRGGLGVAIERLVIVGGEFVLDHERVPLDLDLPEFRGRLLGRREGGVAGHISFEPGRLKMGSAPELAARHRDRRDREPRRRRRAGRARCSPRTSTSPTTAASASPGGRRAS